MKLCRYQWSTAFRLAALFVFCVVCAGCRMDLYTKQAEVDANEMVASLRAHGVNAEKHTPDSGKTWTVTVDEADVVRSMAVLRAAGLPQTRFASLGDLFKKEGLISTPSEERVRFIHGTTEELSATLSRIDGVITARVHVVLPQNDPLATRQKPSSASVFVKYRSEANVSALVPAIKNLVSRGVEGLTYENVSVTMLPGELIAPAPAYVESATWGWWLGGSLVLIVLLVVAGAAVTHFKPQWLPASVRASLPSPSTGATTPLSLGHSGAENAG